MKNVFESDCRGNTEDALNVEVAWFRQMKSTHPETRRLGEILDGTRNELWSPKINRLRSILTCKGARAYNNEKTSLLRSYASGNAASIEKDITDHYAR